VDIEGKQKYLYRRWVQSIRIMGCVPPSRSVIATATNGKIPMKKSNTKVSILALVAVTAAAVSYPNLTLGSSVWDEAVDGSLSTDRFYPTGFGILAVESKDVIGTTVSGISKFLPSTLVRTTW